jgi:hypothetical protein
MSAKGAETSRLFLMPLRAWVTGSSAETQRIQSGRRETGKTTPPSSPETLPKIHPKGLPDL